MSTVGWLDVEATRRNAQRPGQTTRAAPRGCAHLDEHPGAQICYQMSAREQIRESYAT
jgi:hypothetical protein